MLSLLGIFVLNESFACLSSFSVCLMGVVPSLRLVVEGVTLANFGVSPPLDSPGPPNKYLSHFEQQPPILKDHWTLDRGIHCPMHKLRLN